MTYNIITFPIEDRNITLPPTATALVIDPGEGELTLGYYEQKTQKKSAIECFMALIIATFHHSKIHHDVMAVGVKHGLFNDRESE